MRFLTVACLILAAASRPYARKVELDYGYPFYLPVSERDSLKISTERSQFGIGVLFEPAPFLLAGPRLGWTHWKMTPDGQKELRVSVDQFQFSYVIRPRKRVGKGVWLFFEAAGMLEYSDLTVRTPKGNESPLVGSQFDKNEWGAGRSLGLGIELPHFTASINHDAHLAELIGDEFAGLRLQLGAWF